MKGIAQMLTNAPNREQWLTSVTNALRLRFTAAGYTAPDNVKVTCGFPSKSATSRKKQRIGECWDSGNSEAKVFEIFISPVLADSLAVTATLAHELVHATVGLKCGHKGPFAKCATAIGLQGKMTATEAGEQFKEWHAFHAADFGDYPHGRLNASSAPKKQTTRMIKCACPECASEESPYIVRLSAKTLVMGAPICPVHNVAMITG